MSDLTPEELKIIAEGMEYWSVWVYDGAVYIHKEGLGEIRFMPEGEIFNPLTNDAQCMEIMEKLRKHSLAITFIEGETINEAVCKTALEYFKK